MRLRQRIECVDGVSLSVQASAGHYCTPRNDKGPWTAVEVGFPLTKDKMDIAMPVAWQEYADGVDSSVYGYVPVELVEKFISEHGGRKFFQ